MGGDGGVIANQRRFIRGTKGGGDSGITNGNSIDSQYNKDNQQVRAYTCALSNETLRQDEPIVACEMGYLYSKEALVMHLLNKEIKPLPAQFAHIRGLKDVRELQFTTRKNNNNTAAGNITSTVVDNNSTSTSAVAATAVTPYVCPITFLEFNGLTSFYFIWRPLPAKSSKKDKDNNNSNNKNKRRLQPLRCPVLSEKGLIQLCMSNNNSNNNSSITGYFSAVASGNSSSNSHNHINTAGISTWLTEHDEEDELSRTAAAATDQDEEDRKNKNKDKDKETASSADAEGGEVLAPLLQEHQQHEQQPPVVVQVTDFIKLLPYTTADVKHQREQMIARRAAAATAATATAGDQGKKKEKGEKRKRVREGDSSRCTGSTGGTGNSGTGGIAAASNMSSQRLVQQGLAAVQEQARASTNGVYSSLFHTTSSNTHHTQADTEDSRNTKDAETNYSKKQRDSLFIGTSGLRYSIT